MRIPGSALYCRHLGPRDDDGDTGDQCRLRYNCRGASISPACSLDAPRRRCRCRRSDNLLSRHRCFLCRRSAPRHPPLVAKSTSSHPPRRWSVSTTRADFSFFYLGQRMNSPPSPFLPSRTSRFPIPALTSFQLQTSRETATSLKTISLRKSHDQHASRRDTYTGPTHVSLLLPLLSPFRPLPSL